MSFTLHCDRCGHETTPAKNKSIIGIGLVIYNYEDILRKTRADTMVFSEDAMLCGDCRDDLRKVVVDFMDRQPRRTNG